MIRSVANNARGLVYLSRSMRDLGFTVIPSAGNFVMIVLPDELKAKALFHTLLGRGVIIRPLATTGLPNCLRISVGTPDENQYFIETLKLVSVHSVL